MNLPIEKHLPLENPDNLKGIFSCKPVEEILEKVFQRSVKKAFREESPMGQALAFWSAMRDVLPRFTKAIQVMKDRDVNGDLRFSTDKVERDVFHMRTWWLQSYLDHINPCVGIIAALECLPTPVLRRWLWYKNVDFQSYESFLRRITLKQTNSLKHHAVKIFVSIVEDREKNLPCFTKGWQNWIFERFESNTRNRWNRLNHPLSSEDKRYEPKAAIAHDFLSWNLGFKRHSDETVKSDCSNYESILLQPILSKRGEEFSVNTENRGVYWWLYQTLRSNRLWRTNKEVKLNSHVCPGFWFTVIAWAFITLGSPACFVAAISMTGYPVFVRIALYVPGIVTPILLLWLGLQAFFGLLSEKYTGDFVVKLAILLAGTLVMLAGGTILTFLALWLDWREPLNYMIIAFVFIWLALMFSEKALLWPWELPIFGPALIVGVALRGIWLGYVHYPELMKKIIVVSLIFVAIAVSMIAVFVLFIWMVISSFEFIAEWIKQKRVSVCKLFHTERVGDGLKQAKIFERMEVTFAVFNVVVFGVFTIGFIRLFFTTVQFSGEHDVHIRSVADGIMLFMYLFPILLSATSFFGVARNSEYVSAKQAELNFFRSRLNCTYGEAGALLENPVFHPAYGVFRWDLYEILYNSKRFQTYRRDCEYDMIADVLRILSENGLRRIIKTKIKPHLMMYVALGLPPSTAKKRYREDLVRKKLQCDLQEQKRLRARRRKNKFERGLNECLVFCFATILFIPRLIAKVYSALTTLKEIFDNLCPGVYKPGRMQ